MNEHEKKPVQQNRFNWQIVLWALLVWFLLSFLFRGVFSPAGSVQTISYTEFKRQIQQGKVAEVTIKGNEISGKYSQKQPEADSDTRQGPGSGKTLPGKSPGAEYFTTVKPALNDSKLLPLLEKNNVSIHAETKGRSWFVEMLIYLLPWVVIIGLFFYISKKTQEKMMGGDGKGGFGSIFGISKSKAKLMDKQDVNVTFDNVAGLDNAKKELEEIKDYLANPSTFQNLGGELPRGMLLVGPPGVGKTLLAQAAAGEADVPFYSISGSEFIEMFVGVGASRVRDMFQKAKDEAPAIIFIDELDSIGRTRGSGLGGGHDEREQTLNQILSEMDGFAPQESVVVMAATNRPDVLDAALVRPGRFDRQISLELPSREARLKILQTLTRDMPLEEDMNLENLALRTPGLSGADLKNMVNEAALLAARKKKETLDENDFDQARDKILMGLEREDVIRDEDKKVIACHESGHALLAEMLPGADPIQKVTIIPRGRSLGATEQIPEEDRYNLNRSFLLNRIAILLGGRAAEKTVFNEVSNGAADDLKKATDLARRMVCQWGMSETIGPVTFRLGDSHPFLGQELTEPKDFSEQTAREIDEEIKAIVGDMEQKALDTIEKNREKLDALSDKLLQNETLSREEVCRTIDENNGNTGFIKF